VMSGLDAGTHARAAGRLARFGSKKCKQLRTKPFPPWKAEARHGGQHGRNGQAREVTEVPSQDWLKFEGGVISSL